MPSNFLSIDFPAMILASLCGLCCALLGSVLLLQRKSMIIDTLSHSILPGLALAFIITGTMANSVLFIGASISCVVAALFVFYISKYTVLDQNMTMGIVLTSMFALGIILLEIFIDDRVHLDAEHVLFGALEMTYWAPPHNLETLPPSIKTLTTLSIILIFLAFIFFKHIKFWLFDPIHFQILGFRIDIFDIAIILTTAFVAVAAFEAMGAILVLALFICPAATARMLTDSFYKQILYSCLIGISCGVMGYIAGAILPLWLGFENSVNAAGSVAVTAGIVQFIAMLFAPKYGFLGKRAK